MGALADIVCAGLITPWLAQTCTAQAGSNTAIIAPSPALPAYTSRSWQTDEGLPNNLVRVITQTPDGYLWVGTRMGLARFDGVHFTSFNARNTPALENPNISALCVDKDGSLWIGTYGNGLLRLDGGSFSHYMPTNGLVGDELSAIYCGRDGSLWIGTTSGLSCYQAGKFTNYTRKEGLASDIVRSILEDRHGDIWIATGEGLNRLRAGKIESFTVTNGLPDNSVRALWEDGDGRLWIGSNGGLLCYEQGKFSLYGSAQGLADTFVNALLRDRCGNLWVGTYSGLNRFEQMRFVNEPNSEGATYDLVNCLFEDREGNIWVGSREGLARVTPKRFAVYARQNGLSHNNVMSVLEDRAGRVWVGTWGGGLNELNNGSVVVHSTRNGFPHDLILSLCETADGSIWAGADFSGGLTQWRDGTLKHYGKEDGLLDAPIRVLHEDSSGNIWIGTSRGLGLFRDGTFTNFSGQQLFSNRSIRAICEDHQGDLWVGTEDGLMRLAQGQVKDLTAESGLSPTTAVLGFYEDAAHDLWIATDDHGLFRCRGNAFAHYTTEQGLLSDLVLGIVEDDFGYLWMSSLRGISRVSKAELDQLDKKETKFVHAAFYGKLDGLMSVQCNGVSQPSAWKGRDGRLWFPTTKGVVSVDPRVQRNEAPPRVSIEQVIVDKKPIDLVSLAPKPREPLRIPRGNGEVEVHYTALSLQAAEKDRFRYRMEGADPDWINAETRRIAYYSHLRPGKYRFRVSACNNDGVWSQSEATITFLLRPFFWETPWFLTLVAIAVTGGTAALVRYISLKRIQRKLAALEQQHAIEKERARIARDIHDDLGASLTQITLLSDGAETDNAGELRINAQKISDTAREIAQSLDEIVWAVNPQHDTLAGLVEYFSQWADDLLEDSSIRSRITLPSGLPPCSIPAETRHQLFLAFKEALNNAVRHAQASEIHIEFRADEAGFETVVSDNGCGFESSALRSGGNGLANMPQRLERIGGSFEVKSSPSCGTRVRMTVPLLIHSPQS